MLRDNLET